MAQEAEIDLEPTQRRRTTGADSEVEQALRQAINRSVEYLLSLQSPEGYWVGQLESDCTLESDYIFYLYLIGQFDSERVAALARHIRRKQLPDGGWCIYEGGPSELNATVKAYVALRLAGDPRESEHLASALRRVHELGGLEHTNSYARFYLALAGALDWKYVPAIPPELMLLPDWFPWNVYSVSSWTRGIVVPLTILYALKPDWHLPAGIEVTELFRDPERPNLPFKWDRRPVTWRNFFLALDRIFKIHEALPWKPLRRMALAKARRWMLEHLERSGGLGAIYPAMVNGVFATLALGFDVNDPVAARQVDELRRFEIREQDALRVQPCVSPVWDTAIVMYSLEEAGLPPDHPALIKAAQWLLDQQILGPGDWQVKNRAADPGGWAFEFRNDFYPDVDDTSFVIMALARVAFPEPERTRQATARAVRWLLSMQNRDGGWGAFDRDNDSWVLTRVPYADHNAMIDPSTEDVTARVLEGLGRLGLPASHPAIRRGLDYVRRQQTPEGAWYGRWGVNYVYGTSGVLRMLEVFGLNLSPEAQKAAEWLRSVQNSDGGFGESCASYDDPTLKGQGPSTASQTAWGLIGYMATGGADSHGARRAVRYLLEQQAQGGFWEEDFYTGTGFPRVFYLCYHLYRDSFPLYALSRYRDLRRGRAERRALRFSPAELALRNGNRHRNGRH